MVMGTALPSAEIVLIRNRLPSEATSIVRADRVDRCVQWQPTHILENFGCPICISVSTEPLVSKLPRDSKRPTERGKGFFVYFGALDEFLTLLEKTARLPRQSPLVWVELCLYDGRTADQVTSGCWPLQI
jgi:hypothetical protein